jgi:methionine-rich copper-binding protein CopC
MKRSFTALAAGVAVVATLLVAGVAIAHAPITYIQWDDDSNPMNVIASTNNREMEAEPGSFYLRVYNASGSRVDTGSAVISPDRLTIVAPLQPNLPPGTYRVDWLTTSTDGAVLSGSESLPLPGSFGEPPSAPEPEEEHEAEGEEQDEGEVIAPPSTGDGGLAGAHEGGLGSLDASGAAAVAVVIGGGAVFAYGRRQ